MVYSLLWVMQDLHHQPFIISVPIILQAIFLNQGVLGVSEREAAMLEPRNSKPRDSWISKSPTNISNLQSPQNPKP